jgi:hypothetical protein
MRLLSSLLLCTAAGMSLSAHAVDENGYTAKYECRAGNSNCNVDIRALVGLPCQVTVTTADTNWNKITGNSAARVYCIAKGDHRAKGVLNLMHSGSASARKVLRLASGSVDPWKLATSEQAILKRMHVAADYWLVHRLTIDGGSSRQNGVFMKAGSDQNVFDHILSQRHRGYQFSADAAGTSDHNVLQNSVLRHSALDTVLEAACFENQKMINTRVVNNEMYDCHKAISIGSGVVDTRGMVVENNDLYVTKNN